MARPRADGGCPTVNTPLSGCGLCFFPNVATSGNDPKQKLSPPKHLLQPSPTQAGMPPNYVRSLIFWVTIPLVIAFFVSQLPVKLLAFTGLIPGIIGGCITTSIIWSLSLSVMTVVQLSETIEQNGGRIEIGKIAFFIFSVGILPYIPAWLTLSVLNLVHSSIYLDRATNMWLDFNMVVVVLTIATAAYVGQRKA